MKLHLNPILHGGDQIDPPRWIIIHQSSQNALNGLIFHDFVPFNFKLLFKVALWISPFNPILHGGDQIDPPRQIIIHQSSGNDLNVLIFHDFVPFNIRKVLGRPFLGFLFENSKKFYVENFFHTQSKGGTLLGWVRTPFARIFFVLFLGQKW